MIPRWLTDKELLAIAIKKQACKTRSALKIQVTVAPRRLKSAST